MRVEIRKGLFTRIFLPLSKLMPEVYSNAQFDEVDALYLTELYFAISDAYKKVRLEEGHFTNDYKKAGVTTAAIMAMRPIQFGELNANDPRAFYANPIFAAACAAGILNCPVSNMPREDREQFYAWLDTLRFPSTTPFLIDAAAGQLQPHDWRGLKLGFDELSAIDMIVQKFKDTCRAFELEQRLLDLTDDP